MANNRMWLVAGDKKILLAKYYPDTEWYMYCTETALNTFLEETTRTALRTGVKALFGPTHYKLEYETEEVR